MTCVLCFEVVEVYWDMCKKCCPV